METLYLSGDTLHERKTMNWYKTAERKSLQELLQSLDSNPGVDRKTLAWLKALESKEKGSAINTLTKNPRASIEEMQRLFTKVVPLTEEQERLVRIYPLIGEWMRGVMSVLSGQKREMAFNTLREKAAGIRDWIDRTGERLQGRTLENAVKETEKWHSESISLEKGEYLPTKPEDIIISYQNKYTWQRISSGTDAKIEGNKMNHCVGNYCDDVDEGKIDIYSLRDENNSPLITAGFKHKGAVVVQMKGAADKDPSETYKGYISDILKKLGTEYNDGEEYLDNYNLKNFADLNADDIEKSILLQKIVNNQIAREGDSPDFALKWATRKLHSGKAPKAWEEAISSRIAETGQPPDFGYYWAKSKLESGTAPKAWEEAITSRIGLGKSIGSWAQEWARTKLVSGRAPKAWEEEITSRIVKMKDPPEFAYGWVKTKLESGAAPQEWQAGITSHIERVGYPPGWAQTWAKKVLDSGTAPKAWETAITSYIVTNVAPPAWAQDWVKMVLESGTAPKEWKEVITSHIAKTGYPLAWAQDWAKKALDSGLAPKEWEAGISSNIEVYGLPPTWAQNWYYKNGKYKR